jgi:catechol 2,3-dioxygenase-like lactoylglutathione lyase family enzyme
MGHRVHPGEQLVLALYVRDLGKSSGFYRSLGFEITRRDRNFMELRWEDTLLFLVELGDTPDQPVQPVGNIRILVDDVDEHWERCRSLGVEVLRVIETRDYGIRDFIIAGPDGLSIRFAGVVKAV